MPNPFISKLLKSALLYPAIIVFVSLIAWFRTLNFWFLKGFETSWLMGATPHTIVNLVKSHSFLYYLDWKVFGWNPWGWYLTSLILHTAAAFALFKLVRVLTSNRNLSFLTSLIFVANTAYNDVLTWGSFNSYYPLLLIFMLLALIKFIEYKKNKSRKSLVLSILFTLLAFFTRESGLIIVPIITLYDLIYTKKPFSKRKLLEILRKQSPYYLLVLIFFAVRSWYGGIPGDFADSNVRMRITLLQERRYFTYLQSVLLTIGKLFPPLVLPYPILNNIREFLRLSVKTPLLDKYFFPLLGWSLIAISYRVVAELRKKAGEIRPIFLFAAWTFCFLLFAALAIPFTEEFLSREYKFITMRYGYFAFAGFSFLLANFLLGVSGFLKKNYFKVGTFIMNLIVVIVFIGIQVFYLHKIETEAYASTYSEPKRFYSQFSEEFPQLPDEVVFYIYPHSSGLSDFLYEWSFIRKQEYPNLADEPYSLESQIGAVLKKIKEGKIKLNNVVFLDYNAEAGLINKTETARRVLVGQKTYTPSLKTNDGVSYLAEIKDGPYVETPYIVEINIASIWSSFKRGSRPDGERFRALVDYTIDRSKYLKTVKVKTANTLSQRPGEPFLHVLPENLIDGNVGGRSSWIVDAVPAWIEVDLGEIRKIKAFTWGSQAGSGRTPSTYSYSVSSDQRNWEEVLEIFGNKKDNKIDILKKEVNARHIKMNIHTTQTGSFALLDSFEVIAEEGSRVLNFYEDKDELLQDSLKMFGFISSREDYEYMRKKGMNTFWAKLGWRTNKDVSSNHSQEFYFPFKIETGGQEIRIKIPEAEIFSAAGQIFDKRVTEIYFSFEKDAPIKTKFFSFSLLPEIPL
ncbi:MAG: discoidin domain-containing protein [Patescibacteria group bacterium]